MFSFFFFLSLSKSTEFPFLFGSSFLPQISSVRPSLSPLLHEHVVYLSGIEYLISHNIFEADLLRALVDLCHPRGFGKVHNLLC